MYSKIGPFANGGSPALSGPNVTHMEQGIADNDLTNPASPGHAFLYWTPATVYAAGQQVISPNGDVVAATSSHTSGPSFTPANWALSPTFIPKSVPSAAGSRANRHNAELSLYNATPANMRGFRQALAKARDAQLVTFSFLGDSKIAGWGTNAGVSIIGANAMPGHFRHLLGDRGCPIAGTGPVFTSQHSSAANDTRWSYPGWTAGGTNVNFITAGSAGAVATFTSDLAGTVVEIRSFSNSAPFTYSIDGGSAVSVTPSGSNVVYTTTVTGLANTTHTVAITSTSSSTFLLSVNVRGAGGLQIANHGICGSTANDWIQSNFYNAKNVATTLPSDGVFLSLGINDSRNGLSVSSFKTNMTTIINSQITIGRPLMLLVPTNPQTTDPAFTNWASFISATYDLADTLGVPLLDMGDVQGTWAQANAAGLMYDGLHENSAGYALNGSSLVAALRK